MDFHLLIYDFPYFIKFSFLKFILNQKDSLLNLFNLITKLSSISHSKNLIKIKYDHNKNPILNLKVTQYDVQMKE